MDFFKSSKVIARIQIGEGATQGYTCDSDDSFDEFQDQASVSVYKGCEYAEEYKLKEKAEYEQYLAEDANNVNLSTVDKLTLTDINPDVADLGPEHLTDVYSNYNFNYKPKTKLQIAEFKEKILSTVRTNQVTVITGPTGCGKTTQVPQYILDSCVEEKIHCNIVVTQPRRIAAISIAKRVCEERDWPLGTLCGYKVGLKGEVTEDTRLCYVTIGVFLQRLITCRNMNEYTHVIIDEIHERDQEMDFALLIIKKFLTTNSRNVRVILMSATVDTKKFALYFGAPINNTISPAPIVEILSTTTYPVSIYYSDQISKLCEPPAINFDDPGISEEGYRMCIALIKLFEQWNKPVSKSDDKDNSVSKSSVLVFLPGIYEIEELYKRLNDPLVHSPEKGPKFKWNLLPLHSSITFEEQARIFRASHSDHRKIILATNIAESSITVPDIQYVIDFCLTKHLIHDIESNFSSLQLQWASKANCDQRAGRTGRVMAGRVYRLISEQFYEKLDASALPEMVRCPLEKIVLQTKLLKMGPPKALLGIAIDPPDLTSIEKTVLTLKEIGALLLTSKGQYCDDDGDITFLGAMMAKLPVDVHISKLILLGYGFSILRECVIMGAAMSLKSVFSSPFQEHIKAYNSKLDWSYGSCSDPIAFLTVYDVWTKHVRDGYFQRSVHSSSEEIWARINYIQLRALKEVNILVNELFRRLKFNAIEEPVGQGRVEWNDYQRVFVLKLSIAGAFYPNYFGRGALGGQVDEQWAVKQLGGRDPFKTVYLQNFPVEQPSELYSERIKEALRECCDKDKMKISYDGSCKVYVEFKDNAVEQRTNREVPNQVRGRISIAVYRAVKMYQMKQNVSIRALHYLESKKICEKLGINHRPLPFEALNDTSASNLPGVNMQHIVLMISHIVDIDQFWVMYADEGSRAEQHRIYTDLNTFEHESLDEPPVVGQIYVAPYFDPVSNRNSFYRCRLERFIPAKNKQCPKAQVFFLDYGNTEIVDATTVLEINETIAEEMKAIPGHALQCRLSEIKPAILKNPKGSWSENAILEFRKMVVNILLYGKIYSVVDGVIHIELLKAADGDRISVNQYLVKKGFAEFTEESYLSKKNHEFRCEQSRDPNQSCYYDNFTSSKGWEGSTRIEPPPFNQCKVVISLKGPISPLEMKLFAYVKSGRSKLINVAKESVNSVLLDTDPQDPHERLLVAAHVSQNSAGSTLTLRNTTLMPNIHGLPSILLMMFSPKLELRLNKDKTKYTGVLCGLGARPDNPRAAVFPEHDIELPFDTEITFEDFQNINFLRFWLSFLMVADDDEDDIPKHSTGDVVKCLHKIKQYLLHIILKKRASQELIYNPREFRWNMQAPDILPDNETFAIYKRLIYPLHPGYNLNNGNEDL